MDRVGRGVDPGRVEFLRRAGVLALLRVRQSHDPRRAMDRERADHLVASGQPARVSVALRDRRSRDGRVWTSRDRRHRISISRVGADRGALFSLYHFVAPVVVMWTLRRLGYDKRAWRLAVAALVVVLPINYFWRPGHDINWARGPFFHEQHVVPGWLYLAAYIVVVPLVVYLPTHLVLRRVVSPGSSCIGLTHPPLASRHDELSLARPRRTSRLYSRSRHRRIARPRRGVCAESRAHRALYWFTDLGAAIAEATRTGKPILSLRLLGRLDQELSCANSRFFRKLLYPDAPINQLLRERFVLHWDRSGRCRS